MRFTVFILAILISQGFVEEASAYVPAFSLSSGQCVVQLLDNNVPKEKFILSNMSREALNERLLELWDVYQIAPDFSNVAVLYGGIGNRVEVEIGKTKKDVRIEPVGVIVIGIDGLRQDVLYPPALEDVKDPDVKDPNGSYYVEPLSLGGLGQILKGNPQEPLSQRYMMLPKVTAIFPSITYASWASIFTGKMPKDTGITGNEFFARDRYSETGANTVPGLSKAGIPAGFVSLDGATFDPGGVKFVLNHAIPSEYIPLLSRDRTLAGKITDSAPGDVLLAEPVWLSIKDTLKGKYLMAPDMNIRCDKSKYECSTVSMFNQYALGADWWGTASTSWENAGDLFGSLDLEARGLDIAKVMDKAATNEAVGFIKNYFAANNPDGKRKRFPAVFSVYFSGLDHYAHDEGMSGYTSFFKNTQRNV